MYRCVDDPAPASDWAEVEEPTEAAEGVLEKGEGIAVDRRKGFAEDDDTGGEEDVTLV